MHIFSKAQVASPMLTEHGEIIYELLGRNFPEMTDLHSVAYVVLPQDKSSLLHYHPIAEESYFILKGIARIRIGEEESTVSAGQIVLIPPQRPHKIINTGESELEFLAICVPAWEPGNTVWLE